MTTALRLARPDNVRINRVDETAKAAILPVVEEELVTDVMVEQGWSCCML
jgi:hypothetical protein